MEEGITRVPDSRVWMPEVVVLESLGFDIFCFRFGLDFEVWVVWLVRSLELCSSSFLPFRS